MKKREKWFSKERKKVCLLVICVCYSGPKGSGRSSNPPLSNMSPWSDDLSSMLCNQFVFLTSSFSNKASYLELSYMSMSLSFPISLLPSFASFPFSAPLLLIESEWLFTERIGCILDEACLMLWGNNVVVDSAQPFDLPFLMSYTQHQNVEILTAWQILNAQVTCSQN